MTTTATTTMSYKTITEGSATMVYPADQESTVFYNPVQVQNRDLSTLMIALYTERRRTRMAVAEKKRSLRKENVDNLEEQLQTYEKNLNVQELIRADDSKTNGIHILDALAASGLRSIRYWNEIPGIQHVTINDLDPAAVERAHANLEKNNLTDKLTTDRSYGIRIQHGDATHEMYTSRRPQGLLEPSAIQLQQSEQYDVIDLDPYGSAAPFLDGAVQAIRHGGMLNVTCTDMAALGGSHPETCYGRYAAMPIQRAKYLQEAALRILLQSLAATAAKYGRTIKPILSVGMDFYVRCFVEVYDSKAAVNELSLSIGSVYQSTQCSSFFTIPHGQFGKGGKKVYQPTRAPEKCEETGAPFKVAGPLWLGTLHDQSVVLEALKRLGRSAKGNDDISVVPDMAKIATRQRLIGLLTSVSEELHDVPLYYTLPDLCHTLACSSPRLADVRAALLNAGYRVGGYHKEPDAIKTDAPNHVVWDVMRVWCQKNPPKMSKKKKKKLEKRQRQKQEEQKEKNKNDDDDDNNNSDTNNTNPSEGMIITAAEKILAVQPLTDIDFTVPKGGFHRGGSANISRFPLNPEKNWGPKPRASGNNSNKRKRDNDAAEEEVTTKAKLVKNESL